jgi:beta-carotene ketolase (CrtO type)
MSKEERYDIVIIGAGHNGTTAAAYLAKCGLSVCVLEERPECGGAQENAEPVAGVHISPHAVGLYGGAAPGWEQLELWKYGARMDWTAHDSAYASGGAGRGDILCTTGVALPSQKDLEGWVKLGGMLSSPPFTRDLLRATFWCPPHPPEVELTADNIPFMQVYKKHLPEVWTKELLEWTYFDLMDEHMETEPWKTMQAFIAWYSGAAGHFEGMGIPAFASVVACTLFTIGVVPMGGIHGYYHALFRCAVAHGAVFRTCCPVDEIIVQDGRATGVRLRDNAVIGGKTIWANKAVLSATDIKQTFLKMIGPKHLDASFNKRIEDLSLKGGSIYVNNFHTREQLRVRREFRSQEELEPHGVCYPMDSREIYYEAAADVMGFQGIPKMPAERVMWLWAGSTQMFDQTCHKQCTRPNEWVENSFEVYVPPPEYQVEGPDALNKHKAEMDAYMLKAFSQVIENLNSDNIIHHWGMTPWEQEFRNTGMLGGTWYGIRQCRDQWWNERPLPELARYRTPIDGLYLCHQSSAHPGGLCLMAIGYNLMHMLIEDGIAEPGDWWYPSPWYIPQDGKISAIPR